MDQPRPIRLGAIALALGGLSFFAFPVVRPYFETSPDPTVIARGFASNRWVIAHALGMFGFVLLPIGFFALYERLRATPIAQTATWALVISWIGAGLTLPFFGAEAFGLQVVGEQALRRQSSDVMAVADRVRLGLAIYFLLSGLLLFAISTIVAAVAVWKSRSLPRWSGVLIATAFVLYFPQFATPPAARIAHGLLIAVGAIWLAYGLMRSAAPQPTS